MNLGWVFGSMLLVAGGFIMSTIAMGIIGIGSPYVGLLFWAAGSFAAGFVAARASEEKTIMEPAIGAGAFVATIILGILATPFGAFLKYAISLDDGVVIGIVIIVLAMMGGAVGGAIVGERTQEEDGEVPKGLMIAQAFLMILGGFFMGLWAVMLLNIGKTDAQSGGIVLLGLALGPFIGGIASTRTGATKNTTALGCLLVALLFFLFLMRIPGELGVTAGVVLGVIIVLFGSIGAFVGAIGQKKKDAAAAEG